MKKLLQNITTFAMIFVTMFGMSKNVQALLIPNASATPVRQVIVYQAQTVPYDNFNAAIFAQGQLGEMSKLPAGSATSLAATATNTPTLTIIPIVTPVSTGTKHFTANETREDGTKAYTDTAAIGFTVHDTGMSTSTINALPDGSQAMVWVGIGASNCSTTLSSTFTSFVLDNATNPKLYGFYLTDEPIDNTCVAAVTEYTKYIHDNAPGKISFILLTDWPGTYAAYRPDVTGVDLIGLDPYPVKNGAYDVTLIPNEVNAAITAGIPLTNIVPVFQTFGGAGWDAPTANQLTAILSQWDALVPSPQFDYAYSWGTQSGYLFDGLVNRADWRDIMAIHNNAQITPTLTPSPLTPTQTPLSITPTITRTPILSSNDDEIHYTVISPSQVTIDWRGSSTVIRYGIANSYGQTVNAVAPSHLPYSSAGPFWEAKLTGLQPDTIYHYSIGNGIDHTFRTPLSKGDYGFTVNAIGDIGDSLSFSRVAPVQAMIANDNPELALIVGDLTYGHPNGQAVVDRHFNDVQVWSLNGTAYMPAWGNHEWDTPSDDNLNNYKGRFDLPNQQTSPGSPSVSCCGEDWYWFDYGNTRFIAYPEPFSGAWRDWNTKAKTLMDAAQADPSITFIVTFGHRPAYSTGYHHGDSTLAGYMGNLGANHSKYILNVNGHSHNYERTFPQSGVTHITVGTGGSALEEVGSCLWSICTQPSWSAKRYMRLGVLKLEFNANNIQGSFICGPAGGGTNDIACTTGEAIDTFTITGGGLPITPTMTRTPIPPTATQTSVPTATSTATLQSASPIPPPATPTPVSASPTPTLLPPTSMVTASPMPVLPTATQTSVPTATTSTATLQPASPTPSPAIPTTTPTGINNVEVRVAKGMDDVEESSTGSMYINSSDLELVYDGSNQIVGIRFAGVNVPKGATITNAYLQFKVDETSSSVTTLSIKGEASSNALAFSEKSRNISSRLRTTKAVSWSPSSWLTLGAMGTGQRTPNLAPIVQEIVSQTGWVAGNSLVMIITGSGKRVARAYEVDSAGAPLLHIEYTIGTVLSVQ